MGEKPGQLNSFVPPRPNRLLIGLMTPVNRWLMLKGMPLLRDVPVLNRVPGIRGIANVREIDFPDADRERLETVCGKGKATFLTPNHPEFFTDWMIDKEIVSKVAPLTASWATNGVVNGLGRLAQRFWLANNLIAQIPGSNDLARQHSVDWAVAGNGVLLHPEGAVGWHGDWVAPLMPGAAEMAVEALAKGRAAAPDFEAWLAPIVWKLVFLHDADAGLQAECAYVEHKLGIAAPPVGATTAQRIHTIYQELLFRDERKAGVTADRRGPVAVRLEGLAGILSQRLAEAVEASPDADVLRAARRWLRDKGGTASDEARGRVKQLAETLQRLKRLGPFAWADPAMTQEQAAEHIKRIRNDYCAGTLRDTLNRFVPQPVGPRRAIIRAPEPIPVHAFDGDAGALTAELRRRLQAALDGINTNLYREGVLRTYPNPFAYRAVAVTSSCRG
ncbi:hypothetical protein RB623_28310 [Mesorhizobium sp. LHD-90]|uniref:hypothetical protein n=1 Tax=Mesorhizobium sp. LHD-90 TaxID=3071414 RepID=UPI0027DEB790|nr:hypothetical protein [Mesorhizobium sp. LHD-90]MDQ6437975.1 hypothetical protein [Mesorhizobium sp. LHD-90]